MPKGVGCSDAGALATQWAISRLWGSISWLIAARDGKAQAAAADTTFSPRLWCWSAIRKWADNNYFRKSI